MLTHKNYINMGLQLTEADPLADTDEYLLSAFCLDR
jgi:hypothetical protein